MTYLRYQVKLPRSGTLVLDNPKGNSLAHRFYFRCGVLAVQISHKRGVTAELVNGPLEHRKPGRWRMVD